jgi:uncharacterized phage-associated protein
MMKSPYTGKEMLPVYEQRTWNFRGEPYPYVHTAFRCEDTGEQFTTDETDTAGFMQVTNQYRAKYGIPFTDEIIAIRARYGVSATKMSVILGLGVNQWRLYESGEVPNVSNGRMIRSIMNPKVFQEMVASSRQQLSDKEYTAIMNKMQAIIAQSDTYHIEGYEQRRIFQFPRGVENGYASTSLERLKSILIEVLHECGDVFCTKMNKLLFYIDFLSYRQRGIAMTGLSYKAINYGPVPDRWDRVYSEFDEITQESRMIGDYEGSVLTTQVTPNQTSLSDADKDIIQRVCNKFRDCSATEISAISHAEPAWQKYQETHAHIPFIEAFELLGI